MTIINKKDYRELEKNIKMMNRQGSDTDKSNRMKKFKKNRS